MIEVTELGIIVFLHPATRVLDDVSIIALQLFLESYFVLLEFTSIDVSPEQPVKIPSPILDTELGMVIDVRLLQPQKELFPIFVKHVKLFRSVSEVILLLLLNTAPKFVTVAASALLISPSPLTSHLDTQAALTFASMKLMMGETTVTIHLAHTSLPSFAIAEITAVPEFHPVTIPSELTLATDGLFDDQIIDLKAAVLGNTEAVSCSVNLSDSVSSYLFNEMDLAKVYSVIVPKSFQ